MVTGPPNRGTKWPLQMNVQIDRDIQILLNDLQYRGGDATMATAVRKAIINEHERSFPSMRKSERAKLRNKHEGFR